MSDLMISGEWKVDEVWWYEWPKKGRRHREQYKVIIHQNGQTIKMEIDEVEKPVFGKIEGSTARMGPYSYPDKKYPATTKVYDFVVEFFNDGKSGNFQDSWDWERYDGRERYKGKSEGEYKWVRPLPDEEPIIKHTDESLVVINWEKLTNWKDAYNKNDKTRDYGIYQIKGWHTVFKDNSLLYIGKANEQTFGKRISQEKWLEDEWDLTIYLGRIKAINDKEQFSVNFRNNIISDVEALLIYFHSPPYNSVSISEEPKHRNDLRIINVGDSGSLYTEISHKGLRLYK